MDINIDKFEKVLKNKKDATNEDALTRELLEACNFCFKIPNKIEYVSKFNYKIFKLVYDELNIKCSEDMNILNDMIKGEYLFENLDSTIPIIDDEDEIY